MAPLFFEIYKYLMSSRYLCLVTVIKNDEAKDKKGLIDYNCHIFQDALTKVFAREWENDKTTQNGEASESKGKSKAQGQLETQLEN